MLSRRQRTGQSAAARGISYKKGHQPRSGIGRLSRKAARGNSYVNRPADQCDSASRNSFIAIPGLYEIEGGNFSQWNIHHLMDKAQSSSDSTKGFGGLVNMGLTCYGNAVMQNLRHLSKLTWIMEEGKYNTLFKKGVASDTRRAKLQGVTRAFAEIVQLLEKCRMGQSVRPGTFWNRLPRAVEDTLYEQLASKQCHDSHEFFLFLLEAIHEATTQEVDMRIVRPAATTPEEILVHGALKAWQDAFSKEYSPFVHMFYGMFHQKTICQTCNNVSHRWEPFNSLKIPVKAQAPNQPCNILAALHDDMLKEEMIDEYVCEKCGPPRRPAKKSVSIWRLPLTLVLTLKRWDERQQKVNVPVTPLPLMPIDFTPYFSTESPESRGEVRYTLRGMVDHHGGATGGHYTAQCLHNGNNKWHTYDDESVHEMPAGPHFGHTTYMMFLERYTGGAT